MRRRDEVVELRNYRLHPGQREVLIGVFERYLIEPQEALGANVLGSFRNLDAADRFVWFRGFADFDARLRALDGFYSGDAWKAHRSAANAAMIDSDDVLMLRPLSGELSRDGALRAPVGADAAPSSVIVVTTYFPRPLEAESFAARFAQELAPLLAETGGAPFATFASDHSANTYPRLPVREGVTVFVSVARFESAAAHRSHCAAATQLPRWREEQAWLDRALVAPTQTLRLQPTARSLLR